MLFHDVVFAAVFFAFYPSGNTLTVIFLVFVFLLYFKALNLKYTWVKILEI